jgi:hypothetical protein
MKSLFRTLSPLAVIFLAACCGLISCRKEDLQPDRPLSAATTVAADFNSLLAYRWAPVHLQDVDVTGTYSVSGKADYLVAVNFDNDWVATNNWNNIAGSYDAKANIYYSDRRMEKQ